MEFLFVVVVWSFLKVKNNAIFLKPRRCGSQYRSYELEFLSSEAIGDPKVLGVTKGLSDRSGCKKKN